MCFKQVYYVFSESQAIESYSSFCIGTQLVVAPVSIGHSDRVCRHPLYTPSIPSGIIAGASSHPYAATPPHPVQPVCLAVESALDTPGGAGAQEGAEHGVSQSCASASIPEASCAAQAEQLRWRSAYQCASCCSSTANGQAGTDRNTASA